MNRLGKWPIELRRAAVGVQGTAILCQQPRRAEVFDWIEYLNSVECALPSTLRSHTGKVDFGFK